MPYPQFAAGRFGHSTRSTRNVVHVSSGTIYVHSRQGEPRYVVRWRCGATSWDPIMSDERPAFIALCRVCNAEVAQSGVYFAERDGLIKIGCSRDPGKRVVHLDARLLASHAGDFETERTLHRVFADDLAVGREWFRPSPALLAYIERVKSEASPEPQSEPIEQTA